MALPTGRSRLPELLLSRGMIQSDLAAYLGVTDGFISQVVNGKRYFSYPMARKVAQLFKITMDELCEWDDE